jgi:hypothetical protein
MGPAYYAFALDEPGLYSAMFSSGIPMVGTPTEAGAKAFAALQNVVNQLCPAETERRPLALKIWAFSHGMSGLIASGVVSVMDAGKLSTTAVDALLRDAGVPVPAKAQKFT